MASPSLKEARIKYSDESRGRLQCLQCGVEWTDWGSTMTNPPTPARRPTDWWKCPRGCNADVAEDFPPPGEIEGGS